MSDQYGSFNKIVAFLPNDLNVMSRKRVEIPSEIWSVWNLSSDRWEHINQDKKFTFCLICPLSSAPSLTDAIPGQLFHHLPLCGAHSSRRRSCLQAQHEMALCCLWERRWRRIFLRRCIWQLLLDFSSSFAYSLFGVRLQNNEMIDTKLYFTFLFDTLGCRFRWCPYFRFGEGSRNQGRGD